MAKGEKGYSPEGLVNKAIWVVIFCVLMGALLPTVIIAFNNITTVTGLLFAGVIGSVAAILLGFFVLRGIMNILK